MCCQVKFDPNSGEPNWDQMGEENVIANMTCLCIVGIEVKHTATLEVPYKYSLTATLEVTFKYSLSLY